MPPDLLALGDQLERAAAAFIARRAMRRQSVLNVVASIVVAAPLALAIATTDLRPTTPATSADAAAAAPARARAVPRRAVTETELFRITRHAPAAASGRASRPVLLELPSTLRPALR